MSYRVLITGGRDFTDRARVWKDLSRVLEKHPDMELRCGFNLGCDQCVLDYAFMFCMDISLGYDLWRFDDASLLVVYPGGTDDDIEKAKAAGIPVWDRREIDQPRGGG